MSEPIPATVLVVDDNEANRLLARSTLEDEGYRVLVAQEGASGLALFERERPDCVLLDVRMPGLDGFAVCARIRSLPHGASVPILFLTAARDIDTFDRALAAGGDDFLTKPIQTAELVVRVQTALQLRRLKVEVHEQFDALKRQRDDVMRLQLQKERLTAFVVHDLKNPVNTMDLYAQILLRDRGISGDARAAASQIRAAARKLNRMILGLLDLSKADEGRLSPRPGPVDLGAVLRDILDELEEGARQRSVTLRAAAEDVTAHADEDLLRRVLANLVENASRHAPAGSEVTVTATAGDDATEIRVADRGAGVPAELRDRIFEPFVQIEGEGRPHTGGGRGLGLTFCRLAVEAHGGRIWIEDGAPGAVFCVRLPREH